MSTNLLSKCYIPSFSAVSQPRFQSVPLTLLLAYLHLHFLELKTHQKYSLSMQAKTSQLLVVGDVFAPTLTPLGLNIYVGKMSPIK